MTTNNGKNMKHDNVTTRTTNTTQTIMTLEAIRHKLASANHAEVARNLGITRAYVSAIARGERLNPSYDMVKRLSDYLRQQ